MKTPYLLLFFILYSFVTFSQSTIPYVEITPLDLNFDFIPKTADKLAHQKEKNIHKLKVITEWVIDIKLKSNDSIFLSELENIYYELKILRIKNALYIADELVKIELKIYDIQNDFINRMNNIESIRYNSPENKPVVEDTSNNIHSQFTNSSIQFDSKLSISLEAGMSINKCITFKLNAYIKRLSLGIGFATNDLWYNGLDYSNNTSLLDINDKYDSFYSYYIFYPSIGYSINKFNINFSLGTVGKYKVDLYYDETKSKGSNGYYYYMIDTDDRLVDIRMDINVLLHKNAYLGFFFSEYSILGMQIGLKI